MGGGGAALAGDAAGMAVNPASLAEAGRDEVGSGGIVRDPAVHDRVREEIWAFFQDSGLEPLAWDESPILGGEGNKEFLLYLRRRG